MSEIDESPAVQYEVLAECVADVEAKDLLKKFGEEGVLRLFPHILKAATLSGINMGLGLAESQNDYVPPAIGEQAQTYINGYFDGLQDKGDK